MLDPDPDLMNPDPKHWPIGTVVNRRIIARAPTVMNEFDVLVSLDSPFIDIAK